jgi:PAS domain S-box-containing protein
MSVGALVTVQRLSQNLGLIAAVYERSLDEAIAAERMVSSSERMARYVRSSLLSPEPQQFEDLAAAREDFGTQLAHLKGDARLGDLREIFVNIEELNRQSQQIADVVIQERRSGASVESVQQRFERELLPARRKLDGALSTMELAMRARAKDAQARAERLFEQNVRLFAISLVTALAVLLGLMTLLAFGLRQRKQREHALQVSEAKITGMVSIAADAIISIDQRQRIILFNKSAETLFGFQAAEVLGQPLGLLLPESVRDLHARHVDAFAAGSVSARHMGERMEIHGRRKSGEEFPAEASILKLEVEGQLIMTVVLRDISERRKAEREQRFLAAATAALAESLDAQVTLDKVTRLAIPELGDCCAIHLLRDEELTLAAVAHIDTASAQAIREALERAPIPLGSQHLLAEVARTGAPRLIEHASDAVVQELGRGFEPYQLLRQLGCRSMLFVPLCLRERCIGTLSMMVGPSRRALGKRELALAEELARRAALAIDNAHLYAAAQHATQARDEVLGIVAHDLRSPVNSMTLSASGMLRRLKKQGADAEQLYSVEIILQSTRRMNRLIEDLLDVVRMEAGRLSIQRSKWPAAQLVRDAVEAHRALFADARVELKVELAAELPEIPVDAERILQVFSNLLGNALKFTPPDGQVTVGAEVDEGAVVFHVTDSGVGIPEEHLPHLFDRFWQARSTDRRGAGLGLAIVKGIVEAHGGRIWARSKAGVGSTFSFSLPRY